MATSTAVKKTGPAKPVWPRYPEKDKDSDLFTIGEALKAGGVKRLVVSRQQNGRRITIQGITGENIAKRLKLKTGKENKSFDLNKIRTYFHIENLVEKDGFQAVKNSVLIDKGQVGAIGGQS